MIGTGLYFIPNSVFKWGPSIDIEKEEEKISSVVQPVEKDKSQGKKYRVISPIDTVYDIVTSELIEKLVRTSAKKIQDYTYVSDDEDRDYQIYAKPEEEPVNPSPASSEPSDPNAEYNDDIADTDEVPVVCDPPLASGAQTYVVTTQNNPKITEVVINPLDVNKLGTQTVSVKIQETTSNPIIEVTSEVLTNSMSFPFSLSLIGGTNVDGTWQGSWYNEDEYCENYMLIITATSQSGTSDIKLAFR